MLPTGCIFEEEKKRFSMVMILVKLQAIRFSFVVLSMLHKSCELRDLHFGLHQQIVTFNINTDWIR